MSKLKIHYDGWIALPAAVRRRMGITSGDQLEMEWTSGGLLLRSGKSDQTADNIPQEKTKTAVEEEAPAAEAPAKKPAAKTTKAAPKKPAKKPAAKPARAKSTPSKAASSPRLAASTIPKARGRKKAAAT